MNDLLLNQIAPILNSAVVASLIILIKPVGNAIIDLISRNKTQIEQKIVASGHESQLQTAKEVWNIVDEKFRITENATQLLGAKADVFDKLLLAKIPGLTQDDLNHLRQAIAGEINQGKASLTGDTSQQQILSLQADNVKLQSKINQLNSVLNPATTV